MTAIQINKDVIDKIRLIKSHEIEHGVIVSDGELMVQRDYENILREKPRFENSSNWSAFDVPSIVKFTIKHPNIFMRPFIEGKDKWKMQFYYPPCKIERNYIEKMLDVEFKLDHRCNWSIIFDSYSAASLAQNKLNRFLEEIKMQHEDDVRKYEALKSTYKDKLNEFLKTPFSNSNNS